MTDGMTWQDWHACIRKNPSITFATSSLACNTPGSAKMGVGFLHVFFFLVGRISQVCLIPFLYKLCFFRRRFQSTTFVAFRSLSKVPRLRIGLVGCEKVMFTSSHWLSIKHVATIEAFPLGRLVPCSKLKHVPNKNRTQVLRQTYQIVPVSISFSSR